MKNLYLNGQSVKFLSIDIPRFSIFLLNFALVLIFLSLSSVSIAQIECSTPDSMAPLNFVGTTGECSNLIDQDGSETFPIVTVKMAIHFIGAGNGNFYDGALNDWDPLNGTTQAINLINHCNGILSDMQDNPIQNFNFEGDTRIRFEVVPNYQDGVYFWDDIDDYEPVTGVLNALFIDEFTAPDGFSARGLACSIGSDCDNVKQWGWQSSEMFNGPWRFWNFARILNHEVFHVLGLSHVWLSSAQCSNVDIDIAAEWNGGDRWNSGSTNTMNYVNCQCALSPCQWSNIYSKCYDDHFSFTEIDCNHPSTDIIVDENQTWDERVIVTGNIIVEEGNTLTINCVVELNLNSRIIVHPTAKLIVDRGTLTNMKQCDRDTWLGIKVYGGNSDFDVKFTNEAIIENTSSAAVSMFAPEPWPQIQQYGNGILLADNTIFNNTRRIVEFMSWSPLPNPSYIKDCVQNGGRWSITNWNCQGIEISGNEFNNISDECVVTDSGSFKILNNEFNSGQSDILFNNVSAGIYTLVESNVFNGVNIGYNARGTTFSQNLIKNNSFNTGFVDVMNDGHNQYSLMANTMTAVYGSACFDNGGGVADIHNNDFSGNLAGALSIGRNDDYNFFENCYATTFMDNFINGRVSPLIHSNGNASNNCFTHSGSLISSIQDIGGNPESFNYIEPNDIPVDCRDAILSHVNVNRIPVGTPSLPDCGSSIAEGTTTLNYCWPDRSIKNDVFNAYVWLQNKLNEIQNNSSLTAQQKAIYKQIYLNCFKRVRGYLFEIYIGEEEFQDARDLYSSEQHNDSKVYIFSSYIMENDLSEARSYLNSITALNEPMVDFKIIQNINLDRIPYGPYYNASPNQLDSIETIALKSHPYAAYGKALYYVLTGEVISSEIPDIGHGGIQPKSTNSNYEYKEAKVYPNPFVDQLKIQMKGYEEVDIRITDFYGREVYSKNTKISLENISTNNWTSGTYIVTVKSGDEIILLEKVLLIK